MIRLGASVATVDARDFALLSPEERAALDAMTPQDTLAYAEALPVGDKYRAGLILHSLLEIRLSAEIDLLTRLVAGTKRSAGA